MTAKKMSEHQRVHQIEAATALPGTGGYIVACVVGIRRELHVLGEYKTRAAAEWHLRDIKRFDAWSDAAIFSRPALRVVYFDDLPGCEAREAKELAAQKAKNKP